MTRRHTVAGSGDRDRFVGTLGAILLAIILGFHAHPRVAGAALAGGTGKTDGSDQQWLAAASGSSGSPAWSPDGTRIVFSSDRSDGNLEIYVMDADGSNVTRLTYDAAADREPVWSPDGTAILFYSDRNGDFEVFVMNADGSDQTPLTLDLRLTHTDSADPIEVGDSLTSTLTVSSLSPAPATSAVVADPTPSNTANGTTTQVTTVTTTTTLGSTPNPSIQSQQVTLTATVAPAAATGVVTFYDGPAVVGIRPLIAGQAVLTTTLLPAGTRSLTALYGGDAGHLPSRSGGRLQTVQAAVQDSFHPTVHYPTSGPARAIAVGDVNQDGRADLAVGSGNNRLDILLGTGTGTFQPAVTHLIFGLPSGIALGDLNADGRTDVALAVTSNAAHVLLGNGDGTFQPSRSYLAGDMPSSIAISDFNNDGRPDLVVTNGRGDNVSVLLGSGDGTFLPQLMVAAGINPASVVAVDVNRDGLVDLAVAGDDGVTVLRGNGNGTFQAGVQVADPRFQRSIATADFDLDGIADLASFEPSERFTFLVGTAAGFNQPLTFATGARQTAAAIVADINGDTLPDLATANPMSFDNKVTVVYGLSGSFMPPVSHGAGTGPTALAAGDFNGDGGTDLVVANEISNDVSVLLGRLTIGTNTTLVSSVNPSTLSQAVTLTAGVTPPSATGSVTFFDGGTVLGSRPLVNGQAVLTTKSLPSGVRSLTALYPGINAGNPVHRPSVSAVVQQTVNARSQESFHPAVHYATSGPARAVAVGDVNQDGHADVAVGHGFSLDIRLGTGAGTFLPAVTHPIAGSPRGIALGDFNADGRTDVALAVIANAARVLLGNGDGTFQPYRSYAAGDMPSSIAISDFNNDGRPDLAVTNGDGDNVSVLLGRGDGTFLPQLMVAAGVQPAAVVPLDVNRDARIDLATAGDDGVTVLHGNGDGTFQAGMLVAEIRFQRSIATADVNRDGIADLASVGLNDRFTLLIGTATGAFNPPQMFSTGARQSASVAIADIDGDTLLDLATANPMSFDNNVTIVGGISGAFLDPVSHAAGNSPTALASGDVNGDGGADLVVANEAGISVLLGTAGTTRIELNTSPAGRSITVDGALYGAPHTFYWFPNSVHTIGTTSPQSGNLAGTRHLFASWSDGGAMVHTVTATTAPATYTANFTLQYLLETGVLPAGGGTITASPASPSGFYDPGTVVQLTATPTAGYTFSNWTGSLAGTSANPQSITMAGPRFAFANFTPPSCAANVTSQLNISPGGLQRTITGRWMQGVTISNRTGTPIVGPLALALDGLSSGVALFDPSGFTACALPAGRPFRSISVGADGVLSPGEIVNVTLEFTNPLNLRISYTPRALAGSNR